MKLIQNLINWIVATFEIGFKQGGGEVGPGPNPSPGSIDTNEIPRLQLLQGTISELSAEFRYLSWQDGTLYHALFLRGANISQDTIRDGVGAVAYGFEQVTEDQDITLSYDNLTQDTEYIHAAYLDDGNRNSNIENYAFTVYGDVVDPGIDIALEGATILGSGDRLAVKLNTDQFTGNGGFSLKVNGADVAITFEQKDVDTLLFGISSKVLKGDAAALSYTQQGSTLKGENDSLLPPFSGREVVNNSTQTPAGPPSQEFRALLSFGPTPNGTRSLASANQGANANILDEGGRKQGVITNTTQQNATDQFGVALEDTSHPYSGAYLNGYFLALEDQVYRLTLSDLSNTLFYRIVLVTARNKFFEGRAIEFGVNGNKKDVAVTEDLFNTATFYNVKAVNGVIEITFANALGPYNFLNMMVLEGSAKEFDIPSQPDPPIDPPTDAVGGDARQEIEWDLPSSLQTQAFDPPAGYKILWDEEVKANFNVILNQPHHKFEKDSFNGRITSGAKPNKSAGLETGDQVPIYEALRYSLTGNRESAKYALLWARSYMRGDGGSRDGYGYASFLMHCAIIWSHCKAEASYAGVSKNEMEELIERWCTNNSNDSGDSPIWPKGPLNDVFGSNKNGGTVRFHLSHHLTHFLVYYAMALSIADSRPTAWRQYRDTAVRDYPRTKWALERGGAVHGLQYTVSRSSTSAIMHAMMSHLAKVNGASNTRYLPTECFAAARVFIYGTRPDGQTFKAGDMFHHQPVTQNWQWRSWLGVIAAVAEDSQAYDFVYRTMKGTYGINRADVQLAFWNPLLLAQKSTPITRQDYRNMDRGYQARYPNGLMAARSGFTIEKQQKGNDWAFFQIFNYSSGNHNWFAAGQFHVFYKGVLDSISGAYNGSYYGDEHLTNWLQMSLSSSLAYTQNYRYTNRVRNGRSIGGGGQTHTGIPEKVEDIRTGGNTHDNIDVSRVYASQEVSMSVIGTGRAHDQRYAKKVETMTLVIETKRSDVVLLVIHVDHFLNPVDDSTNVRLVQSVDEVSISGDRFMINNTLTESGETYNGRETGYVFGDGFSAYRWSGWHTSRDSQGKPSGSEVSPVPLGSGNQNYNETGGTRVDIRKTGGKDNSLVTVKGVSDMSNIYPRPSRNRSGDIETYDTLGIKVIVSRTNKLYTSLDVTGNGRTVISCLAWGTYRDQNNKQYTLRGGYVFDEVVQGSLQLRKI